MRSLLPLINTGSRLIFYRCESVFSKTARLFLTFDIIPVMKFPIQVKSYKCNNPYRYYHRYAPQ